MSNELTGPEYYEMELIGAKRRLAPVLQMDVDDDFPPINGLTLEIFFDYLSKNVLYPFEAEFAMPTEDIKKREIIYIEVLEIKDPDQSLDLADLGLMCRVRAKESGDTFEVPLAEVVINQDDPSFHFIEDYCIWYWNIRQ